MNTRFRRSNCIIKTNYNKKVTIYGNILRFTHWDIVAWFFLFSYVFQVKSNAVRALGNFLRYIRMSSLGKSKRSLKALWRNLQLIVKSILGLHCFYHRNQYAPWLVKKSTWLYSVTGLSKVYYTAWKKSLWRKRLKYLCCQWWSDFSFQINQALLRR